MEGGGISLPSFCCFFFRKLEKCKMLYKISKKVLCFLI